MLCLNPQPMDKHSSDEGMLFAVTIYRDATEHDHPHAEKVQSKSACELLPTFKPEKGAEDLTVSWIYTPSNKN
jgi:hypothetical protein